MDKRRQQEDRYGDVFDFLFSAQKEKKNKAVPKYGPKMDTFSSALLDIGSQGAVYPLTSAFNDINKYVGSLTEVKMAGGVKAGVGAGFLLDPNKYSQKKISILRSINSWASVGGSLQYGIDGALASLWARNNGVDSETAFNVGHLYQEGIKKGLSRSNREMFGYTSKDEGKAADANLLDSSINIRLNSICPGNPSLAAALNGNIHSLQGTKSKADRIRATAQFLKGQGIDIKQGARMAYLIWGDPSDSNSLGVFNMSHESARYGLMNILQVHNNNVPYSKDEDFQNEFLKDYLKVKSGITSGSQGAPNMAIQQRRAYVSLLMKKYNFNSQLAQSVAQDLVMSDIRRNDESDIATNTAAFVLSKNIQDDLIANGQQVNLSDLEARVNNILQNKRTTMGMRVQRGVLTYNWLTQSGANFANILQGTWEKFGSDDLNFTKIVEQKKVFNNGELVGSYFEGANSVMGKILGKYYYLHPNNLMKGIFLDGGLLLKWASKNGELNTKHIGYLLYNMRLGKLLGGMAKPMRMLTKGITDIINPFTIAVKNFARKALTTLLGATGLAGLAINFLMNVLGDKLANLVNQIIAIVVLTIFGILFLVFGGAGSTNTNQAVNSVLNNNTEVASNQSTTLGVNTFTDSDIIIPK